MPRRYERIERDVNDDEEQQLHDLENGRADFEEVDIELEEVDIETVQHEEQHSGEPQHSRQRPAASDFTAEELAARPKQPKAARKASTEGTYNKTKNCWWPKFLLAQGWDNREASVFLTEDRWQAQGWHVSQAVRVAFRAP